MAVQQSSPRYIYETVNELASLSDPSPPNSLNPEIQSPPVTDVAPATPFPALVASKIASQSLHLQQCGRDFESPLRGDEGCTHSEMRRHVSLIPDSISSDAASVYLRRARVGNCLLPSMELQPTLPPEIT